MFSRFFRWLIGFETVSKLIEAIPGLARLVNRILINSIVNSVRTRPHPYSTVHDYVSWRSLSDRTWSARHLPPTHKDPASLPEPDDLLAIFARGSREPRYCPKSTCLFPAFAQYLTDGFIRTKSDKSDPHYLKRTTSNHQIDLCPLYGLNREQTLALRVQNPAPEAFGRLKSQGTGDQEFAPFLFTGSQIDPQFEILDKPLGLGDLNAACDHADPKISGPAKEKRARLFAFGGDRVNTAPQAAMINTLLLREHNRLAGELVALHRDWDDDRVFETARNIVIVEFIKIVVEEYINHIAPLPFHIRADPRAAWDAPWNKPNWITTEFSLLYRWHPLIPDKIKWGNTTYRIDETFLNNAPLLDTGLAQGFVDMSSQPAGELGAFNTTNSLLEIELASIVQGRACDVPPYADYQVYMGRERPKRMSDISSNPEVIRLLERLYNNKPEDVEFYVGLFAEDRVPNSPLSLSILTMVAVDAFSQALTNPLLSMHVFNPETFTPYGWEQINEVSSLADLVRRNDSRGATLGRIGMARSDWRYSRTRH